MAQIAFKTIYGFGLQSAAGVANGSHLVIEESACTVCIYEIDIINA